jgi:DNA-binding transcriptional ArsR family regulator
VLADPDCRAIIEATSDEALSASELTDCCDIALSTAYRKIDLLVEAGLLDERSRVTTRGRHEREFRCRVTEIRIDLSAQDGPELTLSWEGRDSASDSPHGVAVDRRLESGNGANAGM